VISIPGGKNYRGLPTISETEDAEPRHELEPSEDASTHGGQAISLQQVMMTVPVGTTTGLTAPVLPTTNMVAITTAGLVASHLLAFTPHVAIALAAMAPLITPQ